MKTQMIGMVAALACGVGVCGENLLKNGDFECGTAKGWGNWSSQSKAKVLKEGAHGGTHCLEYAVDSDKGGFIVNFTPLPSNGTYTVSGWLKGDAGVVEIRIFYRTADGKYIGEAPAFTATKLADWTHFAKAFSLPEKCEAVQVGLHVARGKAWLDDVLVEAGDRVGEAPNEIPNSAFAYVLHENGMPELWNTGGAYSFDTFKPGVHEGEYYRMAPEVEPPVKGARVLFQRGISFSTWKTGPLAGDTDYVFSVWAKSDAPDAKLELRFAEKSETFALSNAWRRCVLKTHLKNGTGNGYPYFNFYRNPVYLSAPMLHAGAEALPWKPSPQDANFADLKGGTQAATKTSDVVTLDVPEASEWGGAAKIVDFHPLAAPDRTESSKYRAFVRRWKGSLHVAVESDSGRKPAVPKQKGMPLVLGNDAAEVFVSSSESGAPFVQFMGGRNGACAATLGAQGKAVAGDWTYAVSETAKGWRAEYELPLGLFGKPDGGCWRINVGVTDFDGAKARYFSVAADGFHASRSFVRMTGLPRGGKTVPPRVATEFDRYTTETVARVLVEDARGEATVTLTGKHNYTGTKVAHFQIVGDSAAEISAQVAWTLLKASGTYLGQLKVTCTSGLASGIDKLEFLFADRMNGGDVVAALWDTPHRAAKATTVTYGGETYRFVALDPSLIMAENVPVTFGVNDLAATTIPVAERTIELYVKKRVDPTNGNAATAGVDDFVGYVGGVSGGVTNYLPVVAGAQAASLARASLVSAAPMRLSAVNAALAVGAVLDAESSPYCKLAEFAVEGEVIIGRVEVGAVTDSGTESVGAIGANATVELLGAKTLAEGFDHLSTVKTDDKGYFRIKRPGECQFFKLKLSISNVID